MYNQPGSEVWCANFLAPWNNHDVNAALKFFTDDAVWEFTVGSQPWGASHSG